MENNIEVPVAHGLDVPIFFKDVPKFTKVWTLLRSTDQCNSPLKIINVWKKRFSNFGKFIPDEERFLFGVTTYFLFLFLKWGKLSKNKNPSMTPVRKKQSTKLNFWVRRSGYLLGRYLMRGSTFLGPRSGLY